MNSALQIAVDLEQGEIRLGTESVRLLPVAGDVFCLNDARGPLVRALKFEERARLLSDAGDRDVASLVADAALVSAGVAIDEIRIAASLALAGGGEEAPAFPECVQFVEQRYGWDEKRIAETMALVVDRLCGQMVQQDSNGWKQIVFQKSDGDLGALISQMATNLSQRATGAERKVNAEPESAKKINSPLTSHQQSRSTSSDGFDSQFHLSPSSPGPIKSVSSVLPLKRSPFRVLSVNTDKTEFETPAFVASEPNEVLAAAPTRSKSIPHPTTIAAASLSEDFPAALKPQSNRVNFSTSQAAAAPAKIEQALSQPLTSFPSWQPLATSSSSAQPSSEPVRMSSRSFAPSQTTIQTTPEFANDWLAEMAQLLEAECDMRGIDP
jgi:hypothetical protein